MDKLIKHRFWILLALVPPLVIFGYIKANGAIQAATEERVKQLDSVLTAIPNGTGPNPTFVKAEHQGLDVFNAELRKAVDTEFVRVWEDQKPRMTWPVEMMTYVPETYRGEFVRESGITYKAEYEEQIDKLWESIEPLKPIKPNVPNSGVTGKVRLDRATIPRHYFGEMLVPSEAIWDAQEDLWMLQLLFDAVRNVNRPAENAAKSTVRWVYQIALMGGDGQSVVRPGAGMPGSGSDGDEVIPGMAGFGVGAREGGGGPGRMQAGGMRGMTQTAVGFNPAEEFGIGFEAAAGMRSGVDAGDEDFGPAVAGRGMGMVSGGIPIRYIAFDASANFQERGFYMSVLIDQRKIADFLVELSNSDWPIKIVRFNVGPNTGGAGARAATPMMAGGMPGGFGTGADSMMGMAMAMGGAAGMPTMPSMPSMPMLGRERAEDDALSAAPGFTGADTFGGTAADMGMTGGMIGASPLVNGDQIGQLFTHPDLVQMDLCGVITMYRPPTPELLAAVTGEAAAAEASAEDAAETDATAADPSAADSATTDPAASDPTVTDPAAGS